jgi:cyclopropane-fatty-acyl-phospholipid synthase
MDCRTIKPGTFGSFDAVVSLGAFEHFCSIEEYKAGKQNEIYNDFFKTVSDLLPVGGRFYLQTMVFSKNMLPLEHVSINDDPNSASYVIALMIKEFPGSWLAFGDKHIIETAAPYFKLICKSSGRLDYIQTIKEWRKKFRRFHFKKYLLYASLIPKIITDKDFRHRLAIFKISPNKVCFEKEILDHYRIVFEKV